MIGFTSGVATRRRGSDFRTSLVRSSRDLERGAVGLTSHYVRIYFRKNVIRFSFSLHFVIYVLSVTADVLRYPYFYYSD